MKSARHAIILDIIERQTIDTQEELATRLREQGMNVTQATVSRDIKELRLIKVLAEDGGYKYATVDKAEAGLKDRFISIFAHSVISMIATGNLAIIRTISGTAGAAAEAIDNLRWEEIAGTLAGDNTIFIAVKEGEDANEMIRRFQTILRV